MSLETLDDWTVERLLRALPPDDAPPGYGGVALLLEEARTEVRTAGSARAEETVAAMVAAVRARGTAVVPRRRHLLVKMAAAASAGLLALSGGMAAAGALPSAAQHQVSNALAKVGIDLPRGNGGHGHHGLGSHGPEADNADPARGAGTTNHGDCVSQVAGSGGVQVSTVARSDCGKPPTAGGAPAENATHGTGAPAAAKPADQPQPTHPPQSSSGGPDGTSPGSAYGKAGIPSPPGLANDPPRPVHQSPPPPSSPPPHSQP
jgi:hypothetical protein